MSSLEGNDQTYALSKVWMNNFNGDTIPTKYNQYRYRSVSWYFTRNN